MAKMIFVNPPVTTPVDAMAGSAGETGSAPTRLRPGITE